MEHFDKLNELVDELIEFSTKLDEQAKYASVVFTVVKLLLSYYSVAEAIGVLSLAIDEIKREKPRDLEELTKSLYI